MRTSHILLLCILGLALFPSVICNGALGPDDCCFTFWTRRVNENLVRSYYMTDSRCAKTAAILVTNKSSRICVDPNLPWVKGIMKFVDNSTF